MSLRSIGSQLLQTVPSSLLSGKSTASVSFWILINPANNVTVVNGVEIFGDSGGKFSASLSGVGGLRLLWSSNDGQTNYVSTCQLTLVPGTTYHIASTWQAGSQHYYLNGVSAQSDTMGGVLGVLGDTTPHPYLLGSGQAGVDVTLDEPTIWVNYALTPVDVANLRDRLAAPLSIDPSAIALAWSLAGTDGASAMVGDPGLTDSSATGLNLSKVIGSAPTYKGGVLTYVPPTMIGRAAVAASGQAISLIFQDGLGNATDVSAIRPSDEIQTLTASANPSGNAFTLTFGGHATAPVPVEITPPGSYGLFTVPVTPNHTVQLAASYDYNSAYTPSDLGFEVFDGAVTALLGRVDVNGKAAPAGPADGTSPSGSPILYQSLGGFKPTTNTLLVRVSASTDGYFWFINALRVTDTVANSSAYYAAPGDQFVGVGNGYRVIVAGQYFDGQTAFWGNSATGIGSIYLVDPAALQSALQALPSIGAGNVVASVAAAGPGQYTIQFVGELANSAQALIASSDPAITIARTNPGAVVPTVSIDGGPAVPIFDWLWGAKTPYSPAALGLLPQSAPQYQTQGVYDGYFTIQGFWYRTVDSTCFSGGPLFANQAGFTLGFNYPTQPPGTYQFAATWPPTIPAAKGVTYSQHSQFVISDGAGNVLETVVVDQTQVPADYTQGGRAWKTIGAAYPLGVFNQGLSISLSTVGLSSTEIAVLDAAQLRRVSADASVLIPAGATVQLTTPQGWATTVAGVVPAVANLTIPPPSPTWIAPPFVAGTKSLGVGFNVENEAPYAGLLAFSNLANRLPSNVGVTQDVDGYPTRIPGAQYTYYFLIERAGVGGGNTRRAFHNLPSGLFVMTWDGASDLQFSPPADIGTVITEVVSRRLITGGVGNRRVYNVQADPTSYSPSVALIFYGTAKDASDPTGANYICDVRNLKVYPPDPADSTGMTEWANPPKFHPAYLAKLKGIECIRTLDPLNTNNNCYQDYDQIKPTSHLSRSGPLGTAGGVVTWIGNPTGDRFFVADNTVIQVTTATPHGMYDGMLANFNGCGTATFSDGSSRVLDAASGMYNAPIKVVDANNILFLVNNNAQAPITMTNTLSGGTIVGQYGTVWPLQDIVDLVAQSGAEGLWFNFPVTVDSSVGGCVDQVAAFLAANLPTGVQVHVEYGNECWNYGFATYSWCRALTSRIQGHDDGSYEAAYVPNAKAVHDRFAAVFAAHGRPADVIYTFCTWGEYAAGSTALIAPLAKSIGARIDELGVGIYFDNWDLKNGFELGQVDIYNRMTADQCLDFLEVNAEYGHFEDYVTDHLPYLATNGYASTRMVAYEAAPDVMIPGAPIPPPGNIPNYFARQKALQRHPRMYGIMLRVLQRCQDAGLSLWNHFNLGSGSGGFSWDAYEYFDQPAGTGDPSLDALNISSPMAMNQVKSEIAGALHYWSSLVPPVVVTPARPKLLRNGMPKATGSPIT